MKITKYNYKKKYQVSKTVYSSGRTRLVYGAVGKTYKTEQEAMNDMDNFVLIADTIMQTEYKY